MSRRRTGEGVTACSISSSTRSPRSCGREGEKCRGVIVEMDDVLAELRHRIMGQLKPARPQHQETPAMTQSVNVEYQRYGSAAVALRRLAHPGRDGAEADPVSEPITPARRGGVMG